MKIDTFSVQRKIDAATVTSARVKTEMSNRVSERIRSAKIDFNNVIDNNLDLTRIEEEDYIRGLYGIEYGFSVKENLKQSMQINDSVLGANRLRTTRQVSGKRIFYYSIGFPNSTEIESTTKSFWGGESWFRHALEGVSNASQFLFKPNKGRSLEGVQVKGNTKSSQGDVSFRDLYDDLRTSFLRLIKR